MDIRLVTKADKANLAAWWGHHKSEAPQDLVVPPLGVVVEGGGKPVAMGYLIETNVDTCLFEWVTRDPALSRDEAGQAISLVIQGLKSLAKIKKYKMYITFLNNKSLMKRFEDNGAIKGDPDLHSYVGVI